MKGTAVRQPSLRERTSWRKAFQRDWHLYVLLLLPVLLVIIFNYAAYPGLRMVFMDYKPARGYDGSKWGSFLLIFLSFFLIPPLWIFSKSK